MTLRKVFGKKDAQTTTKLYSTRTVTYKVEIKTIREFKKTWNLEQKNAKTSSFKAN